MREKTRRRSLFPGVLAFVAVVVMVGMFAGSILCMALAYRTWNGSVVKVHRGMGIAERRYTRLSDEDKDRIQTLIAVAAGSAVVGLGLFAVLKGHAPGRT